MQVISVPLSRETIVFGFPSGDETIQFAGKPRPRQGCIGDQATGIHG